MRSYLNRLKDVYFVGEILSLVFFQIAFFTVQKALYADVSTKLMAFVNIALIGVTSIINLTVWKSKKGSDFMMKMFPLILISESILYSLLVVYFIYTRDMVVYYVVNNIILALLTENIGNCFREVYNDRYKDDRTSADRDLMNIKKMFVAISYAIALVINLDINTAFILYIIAGVVDNSFLYYCYIQYKKK